MTGKEEKAIETFKHWIEYEKANKEKINKADELIEIQETVLKALEQKDKIIDLMARFIDTELSSEHLSKVLKIEVKPLETYREDIKQYFEKKVEESE